jgi:hypothetical protein
MKRVTIPLAVSLTIASPRSAVWEELSRIEDHVKWMSDAVAIRFLGERHRGVGTLFVCDTKVGPIRVADRMEIIEWEEGHAIAVRHQGLISGSGRFLLEEEGVATTLFWNEDLAFPWWLGSTVGAWVARPVLVSLWRKNLQRLRSRIETLAP